MMWTATLSEGLVNLFAYCYSQVLFFTQASAGCHFFSGPAFNWPTIISSLVVYIAWALPIMYLLWPQNRSWRGQALTKKQ